MILLEGKPIAEEIKSKLKDGVASLGYVPRLGIVLVCKNLVSAKFVALKEKFAGDIGAQTRRYEFEENITTNELRARMKDIVHEPQNRGVIIQLPLPAHIDTQSILNTVVPEKDVDVLSARAVGDFQVGKEKILPPVAGAVKALFEKYNISVRGKHVAVLGYGRLVGQPLAMLCLREGGLVTVVSDEKNFDPAVLKNADIVISGMGTPRFIKGEHVKEGVVVVDVGTSEMAGEMVGDVDFESVSKKASYITPQKGGVGPLTVAMVFQNLVILTKLK
jgi:methylenetetrahydrofolate dehydrogenase (NADP+)/methenyltetrahydrofolate cyclohydrolase